MPQLYKHEQNRGQPDADVWLSVSLSLSVFTAQFVFVFVNDSFTPASESR